MCFYACFALYGLGLANCLVKSLYSLFGCMLVYLFVCLCVLVCFSASSFMSSFLSSFDCLNACVCLPVCLFGCPCAFGFPVFRVLGCLLVRMVVVVC